ncbi:hypothetical protein MHBO_000265 [Bonamia ostreae]|uniref:Uncharacterized protein n=1 Tax=Bonamia ostreae TaxID=126728 RepID=A0ABV2AF09_9EUKA
MGLRILVVVSCFSVREIDETHRSVQSRVRTNINNENFERKRDGSVDVVFVNGDIRGMLG